MSDATSYDLPSFPTMAALADRQTLRTAQVDAAIENGYEEGFRRGHEEAHSAAVAEVERIKAQYGQAIADLQSAATALGTAAADLQARDAVTIEALEHHAVFLAGRLATDIVGRTVAATDTAVIDSLKRAGGMVPDRGQAVVRVHPDDLMTTERSLADGIEPAGEPWPWTDACTVVADPSVEQGGCIIDVGDCQVDAQIAPALERMQETLAKIYTELRGNLRA